MFVKSGLSLLYYELIQVEICISFIMHIHTLWRCYKVTISLVSKVGTPFIPPVLLGSKQWHQSIVWWNSCSINCARYSIRHHSRVFLLALPVSVLDCWWLWERHHQPNTLTMRKCFIVQYFSYFTILSSMNSLQSFAIRRFQ
jgi:hypothetical protein